MLQDPLFILAALACGAVALILVMGISSFGKEGLENAKRSNKFMRWRLIAQFFAILVILAYVYIRRNGG